MNGFGPVVHLFSHAKMYCACLQVTCLIELVQTGAAVAHHLWVLLFPIVWSSLKKEQQVCALH